MSREEIQKVIDKLPQLTDAGVAVNIGNKMSQDEYEKKFHEDRESLLNSTEVFEKTCKWLEHIQKIKTINQNHSSSDLKHIAERETGYISNGVFIAAAIHCGFDF